jgi:hypothetical protein
MVLIPEPSIFCGIVDQEMNVLGDLCRLDWREVRSSDGGIRK